MHYNKKSWGSNVAKGRCTVEDMSTRVECIKEIGSKIAYKNALIVIPTNTPYLTTAKNLACTLARLGMRNVVFWALDLDVYETLLKQDKLAILLPGLNPLPDHQSSKSNSLKNALRSKPKLIKYILSSGLSAWIMDADMVAVQDFREIVEPKDGIDLYVSVDVKSRQDISPHSVSSSLVYYSSNQASNSVLDAIQSELDRSSKLDDEEALRRVLTRKELVEMRLDSHVKRSTDSEMVESVDQEDEKSVNDAVKEEPKVNKVKSMVRNSKSNPTGRAIVKYLDPFQFISSNLFEKSPKSIPKDFKNYATLHLNGGEAKKVWSKHGYWMVDEQGFCLVNGADPDPLRF